MGVEGYCKSQGRIFEGDAPYILLCPQCGETLECTDDKGKGYCFGCDVVWDRKDVKEKCRFIGDEPAVEFKEEESHE